MSALASDRFGLRDARWGRVAASIGAAGATLGLVAGLVELTAGPAIRSWVGNKEDTTRLGLATLALAAIALTCALTLRRTQPAAPKRLALAAGMLLPGLVCFTTVGRLWFAPGALLVVSGVAVVAGLAGDLREVATALARNWTGILTAALAAFSVFLGATALGYAGVLGIAGGLLVLALLAARDRLPARLALPLLLVGAVPFAVATWWSIATPLVGVLLIAIGTPALVRRCPTAPRTERDGVPSVSWSSRSKGCRATRSDSVSRARSTATSTSRSSIP